MVLVEACWVDRASCGENVVILVSGVLTVELWLPKEEDIGDAPTPIARDMADDLLFLLELGLWKSLASRLVEIRVRCYLSNIFC